MAGVFYFSGISILLFLRPNREQRYVHEVKLQDQTDAAYIAGLIDGEGTVILTRRHRSENRQLVVSISNTDRPLLEYVLDTVAAGKITGNRT